MHLIIGSGIASLNAAALLARAGKKVLVLERNDWLGGNIRTREDWFPGFKIDQFSGFHPLFTTSPTYKELQKELEAAGLEYLNTDLPTGVLLPDGRSAVFYRERAKTVEELNRLHAGDGDAYRAQMEQFGKRQEIVFGLLNNEIMSFDGLLLGAKAGWQLGGTDGIISFLGDALPTARKWLENHFRSEVTRALFAPWVLHTGLGPDDAASSLMDRVIFASFEQTGMPVPKGGGQRLSEALIRIIEENGGELRTGVHVAEILTKGDRVSGIRTGTGETIEAKIVLANVTPTQLYGKLLRQSSPDQEILESTENYRYGRGNMQMHLVLDRPPAWPDERLLQTGIVHLTPGLNGVSRAVNEATRGLLPAEPTIVFGQHAALDPSRAPEGKWTVWIQLQELPNFPSGDALDEIACDGSWTPAIAEAFADRVVAQIDRVVPGFADSIEGRKIMSPADLANLNINLVNGDPYSGQASLDQLFVFRPLPELRRHETPIKGLYHIGASTHPGPGLNGTSGHLVAKELI